MKQKEMPALAIAAGQAAQTSTQTYFATGGYQQTPWRTVLLAFPPVRASTVVFTFPLQIPNRSPRDRYSLVITHIDPTPNDNATGVYLLPPTIVPPRVN